MKNDFGAPLFFRGAWSVERQSVMRDDASELRTLYALTPAENQNVRNAPDGRKLILRVLLVRWRV